MDIDLETCLVGFLIGFALYLLVNRVFKVEGVTSPSPPWSCDNRPPAPGNCPDSQCLNTDVGVWACDITNEAECNTSPLTWCKSAISPLPPPAPPGPTPPAPSQSPSYKPLDNATIRIALRAWVAGDESVEDIYGPVSGWDVSQVTDMSHLFADAASFNQDISKWDVGKVTNMNHMFAGAKKFNQDISGWDVAGVKYMSGMFTEATSFDQGLCSWRSKLMQPWDDLTTSNSKITIGC